ncbi:hypothetical protein GVAV_000325 [Gurleya vavrai]
MHKHPISSFVYIYDEETFRPYTPIFTSDYILKFAIKKYEFGRLSNYLSNLPINSDVKISDPVLKRKYKINEFKDVLLIAGGTGITPMMQILDLDQKTNFTLVFCNLSIDDIFLLDKLNSYESVKIIHVLAKKIENHKLLQNIEKIIYGLLNNEILEEIAVLEGELLYDFAYVCGPPAFMQIICGEKNVDKSQGKLQGVLKNIGFKENQVYKF